MPTYQYACTACEHRFEAVQKFSDASLSECPECTGRLRKVFSSVGIVFKGSGFYRTDSRKGGSTVTSGESGSSDGGKDSGSSGSEKSGSEKSGSEKSGSSGDKVASSSSGDKAGSSASKASTSRASSTPAAAAS